MTSLRRIRHRCGPIGTAVYLSYRLGNRSLYGTAPRPVRVIGMAAYRVLDLVVIRAIANARIPAGARIGHDVGFVHDANGTIVSPGVTIGDGCTIFHQVTIGTAHNGTEGLPIIGNNVTIGAGAKVLGGIHVGDGARIGANAVVLRDVPAGAIAVGVPARVL